MATIALGLTVVFLHSAAGLVGPLALGLQAAGPVTMPAFGYLPALPPVEAAGIEPLLKRELPPELPSQANCALPPQCKGEYRGLAAPNRERNIPQGVKTLTRLRPPPSAGFEAAALVTMADLSESPAE
jgi:hypothetical protein